MTGKHEPIAPSGDRRLVRRDEQGRSGDFDDLGRSLAQDAREHANTQFASGGGDRGDQQRT